MYRSFRPRYRHALVVTLSLCLSIPHAGATVDRRSEIRSQMLAAPGMRETLLEAYKAQAVLSMRLQRLVTIGQMCRLLDDGHAGTIRAAATSDLEEAAFLVADEDKAMANAYLMGVEAGATRSADVLEAIDEVSCKRFAQPGGALTKIMTWTGEPQYTAAGTRASPRTIP